MKSHLPWMLALLTNVRDHNSKVDTSWEQWMGSWRGGKRASESSFLLTKCKFITPFNLIRQPDPARVDNLFRTRALRFHSTSFTRALSNRPISDVNCLQIKFASEAQASSTNHIINSDNKNENPQYLLPSRVDKPTNRPSWSSIQLLANN